MIWIILLSIIIIAPCIFAVNLFNYIRYKRKEDKNLTLEDFWKKEKGAMATKGPESTIPLLIFSSVIWPIGILVLVLPIIYKFVIVPLSNFILETIWNLTSETEKKRKYTDEEVEQLLKEIAEMRMNKK